MPQKAHLLIVDDEANTLASLSRAFRLEGHEATVCDNAAKALELASTQPFDLIFSDVVMPGKDGLALLEELKAQGVPTPVVMMSGQAHIEMAVRATRLGALDFLEKPISTDKLLLTVENALKLGAAGAAEPRPANGGSVNTRLVWTRRNHAARDGAGGARGGERDARLHSGRNRYRQGTRGTYAARAQPAARARLLLRSIARRCRPN